MNFRIALLKHLIENGTATRDEAVEALGVEKAKLSQTFYQLVKLGAIEQHGDTPDPNTTYSITEEGRDYYNKNKDKKPRGPKKSKEEPVAQAPILPNISVSAESLADQISSVLAENSELRNALVDMRSTINRLLGEEPIYFGGEDDG